MNLDELMKIRKDALSKATSATDATNATMKAIKENQDDVITDLAKAAASAKPAAVEAMDAVRSEAENATAGSAQACDTPTPVPVPTPTPTPTTASEPSKPLSAIERLRIANRERERKIAEFRKLSDEVLSKPSSLKVDDPASLMEHTVALADSIAWKNCEEADEANNVSQEDSIISQFKADVASLRKFEYVNDAADMVKVIMTDIQNNPELVNHLLPQDFGIMISIVRKNMSIMASVKRKQAESKKKDASSKYDAFFENLKF
jgi:hypothetical protein